MIFIVPASGSNPFLKRIEKHKAASAIGTEQIAHTGRQIFGLLLCHINDFQLGKLFQAFLAQLSAET